MNGQEKEIKEGFEHKNGMVWYIVPSGKGECLREECGGDGAIVERAVSALCVAKWRHSQPRNTILIIDHLSHLEEE